MEHLITMTDFVLENSKEPYAEGTKYKDIVSYAHFLKKPLKLGYFIPCDKNDVPLEEPKELNFKNDDDLEDYCFKYSIAKQRVLFEGFEYDSKNEWITYKEFTRFFISELQKGKIEDLLKLINEKVKLTETAEKEIGI